MAFYTGLTGAKWASESNENAQNCRHGAKWTTKKLSEKIVVTPLRHWGKMVFRSAHDIFKIIILCSKAKISTFLEEKVERQLILRQIQETHLVTE